MSRNRANSIYCEVVVNHQQMLHAQAIMAICFMEEHRMKPSFVFDGNEFQATHLVAYEGEEPIGTLRIRWFRDFAQIERTSVRKAWRNARTVKICGEFAFDHIARKGYDKVVTHASSEYARLWQKLLGFSAVDGEAFAIQGHPEPYVELVRHLVRPLNAIGDGTSAQILNRLEGSWDVPDRHEVRQ